MSLASLTVLNLNTLIYININWLTTRNRSIKLQEILLDCSSSMPAF